MYLRLAKYNVDKACQKFEQTFLFQKRHPHLYQCDYTEDFDKMMKLLDGGYCYPIPGYDSEGRKVVVFQQANRDCDVHSPIDIMRFVRFVLAVELENPETQIGGMVLLFDYENMELKHLMPPTELKQGMEYLKAVGVRQKQYLLMNMTKVSQITLEVMKTFMSEKLKSRINIIGDRENLKNHFQPISMLPKKFGGEQNEAEVIKIFRKTCEEKLPFMDATWKAEIIWENVPAEKLDNDYQFEDMGSFRKLEID